MDPNIRSVLWLESRFFHEACQANSYKTPSLPPGSRNRRSVRQELEDYFEPFGTRHAFVPKRRLTFTQGTCLPKTHRPKVPASALRYASQRFSKLVKRGPVSRPTVGQRKRFMTPVD